MEKNKLIGPLRVCVSPYRILFVHNWNVIWLTNTGFCPKFHANYKQQSNRHRNHFLTYMFVCLFRLVCRRFSFFSHFFHRAICYFYPCQAIYSLPITFLFFSITILTLLMNVTTAATTTTTMKEIPHLVVFFSPLLCFFPHSLTLELLLFFNGHYVLMYSSKFVAKQSPYLFNSDQFGQHIQHVNHKPHCRLSFGLY